MNKHRQLHSIVSKHSVPVRTVCEFTGRKVEYVSVCQIDRFFEQPQNRTSLGFIDTSPYAASTPSAEQHVNPVQGGRNPSKLKDDDLFDTTVSKHCQTLGEVSQLAKAMHKPAPEDFEEVKVDDPVPSPAPAPVSE